MFTPPLNGQHPANGHNQTMEPAHNIIMIISDSRQRSRLSLLVRELGHSTFSCPDPQEALSHIRNQNHTIAIVEQEQIGCDSIDLVSQIARLSPSCRILLLTDGARVSSSRIDHLGVYQCSRLLSGQDMMTVLNKIAKSPTPSSPRLASPNAHPSGKNSPSTLLERHFQTNNQGLTQAPFLSHKDVTVSSDTHSPFGLPGASAYMPTYLVAKCPPSRELVKEIWHSRHFKNLVIIYGEEGSEFECVLHELNLLSGTGDSFPFFINRISLQREDHLKNINAQSLLRESTPPIVYIHEVENLTASMSDEATAFIRENAASTKRHVRVVISAVITAEEPRATRYPWLADLEPLSEGIITVPPLRDRPQDIPYMIRHTFNNLTTLHPFVNVRRIEDSAIEYLSGYLWKGNFCELVNVLRAAIACCPRDSLTLQHLHPLMNEDTTILHLMESTADERLLSRETLTTSV